MRTQTHSSIPAAVISKRILENKNFMAMDGLEKMSEHEAMDTVESLQRIGIGGLDKIISSGFGMDTIQNLQTTASIPNLVQFLQNWLPGLVKTLTAARKIDEIIGINTSGNWHDEQIVQQVLEPTGAAVPYGDDTNVPFTGWNTNFVPREVVRFELGMRVGRLEEARAGASRVNSSQEKRESCGLNLEIARNEIGFFGYNAGNNNTYGFLNDPNLPGYTNVANTGTGSTTTWSTKTQLQIIQDLLVAFAALQNQTLDNVNPEEVPTTLALATASYQYLNSPGEFGYSVRKWLSDNYPKCRVVSAPQLNSANGGANVFYIFADSINDLSTDDGKAFVQVVPAKFMALGVQPGAKGYEEDYSNATAGTMVKRPYLVTRWSGI